MGHLIDGGSTSYEIEDRMLCHLKTAVAVKLRRQESFLLSWSVDLERGSGRVSLWMHPSIPLKFAFSGSRPPSIDQEWVHTMLEMANTSRGLVLLGEEDAARAARGAIVAPV